MSRYSLIFSPVALTELPRSSIGLPILAIASIDLSSIHALANGGWGFWKGLGRTEGKDTCQYLPLNSRLSVVQALTKSSSASSNCAAPRSGVVPNPMYS